MGVLMQAFYWDCPREEGHEGQWWNFIAAQAPLLKTVGFTALWLPPASKAASLQGPSMGYDPYDYYDLGDFVQKGATKTWFGNSAELEQLTLTAHRLGMQVYADFVINHNSGGDQPELNPIDGRSRWTKFTPLSGKFPRDLDCFHPSRYETWDGETFGDMPDLCHRNPYVYAEIIRLAQWLIEEVGFDGFRFDFVKGYGSWMVKALSEIAYLKSGLAFRPFSVGECWDSDRRIEDWLTEVNAFLDNPVCAFDFPLRYRLKDLCDTYGFNLRTLAQGGTVVHSNPTLAVTFVDNHDTTQTGPNSVINDKLLAYSFILTHEGYPCVFWKDYFTWGLAREGTANGIAALVSAHEKYAGGTTRVLHVDDELYVMERTGFGTQPGLVLVINNRGDRWNGAWVQTQWKNTRLVPIAWSGRNDNARPQDKWSAEDGRVDLWAAPRGYSVYVP